MARFGGTLVEETETTNAPKFGGQLVQTPNPRFGGQLVQDEDPSLARIGGGLVADIAIAEGTKYAMAAGGATLGPLGAIAGYVTGAITGGVSGSLIAQEIEGREDVSWGRVVGDTLLNFIPGGKLAKGGTTAVRVGKAAAKQGAAGAVIAPAAQTVESVIEEGKIPEKEELIKMAGMGAALGGGLGGASVGLEKVFGKIGGKSVDEVDDLVTKGDLTFSDFVVLDKATTPKGGDLLNEGVLRRTIEESVREKQSVKLAQEIIASRNIADKQRGVAGKIFASLAPSKVLGRRTQQASIDFQRNTLEAEELGSRLAKNLEKKIAKNPELNDTVNKILDGEPLGNLDADSVKKLGSGMADIKKYIEMRNELGNKLLQLIDEGAYKSLDLESLKKLQQTVAESISGKSYNRKEYRLFLDKDYFPDAQLQKAAFNELAAKMGATKAKKHMDALQNASAANKNESSRIYFGSAVDSVLKKRHNPGKAERAWLGEVTEAPERIRGTLSGMGRSTARAEADARILDNLLEDGIGSRQASPGMVEVSLRGTGPEGTGVYVNPEVQVALKQIYLPSAEKGSDNIVINAMQDLYRASVGGSKAAKVLMNTVAYPVQLYGNTATLMGMGINPFRGAKRGADLALAEFGGIERLRKSPEARKAMLDEIQQMNRYGLKGVNILDSDLRSTLDNGIFSKMVGKITDPLGKVYSVPDTMGRYVGWKANQRTLRNIFPDASDEIIRREAANMINDTYQNYDKLSNVIRILSRWGVMPQFFSFTAEFTRNQYNQGKTIASMMSGKFGQDLKRKVASEKIEAARLARKESGIVLKPDEVAAVEQKIIQGVEANVRTDKMRIEATKRLASLTAVYAGTYGIIEGFKAATGLTQEDDDALRNLDYAPYEKNKQLLMKYDKETRKGWKANPSYIIPHAIGISAFKAGLRGEDEASVIGMLSEEMIGEGSFIMQEAFRAIENRDRYGNKISNELDELKKAQDRIKYFITESFKPGVSREIEKFSKAKRGAGDLSLAQVGRRQLGLRYTPMDLNESAKFSISRNSNPAKKQASKYYSDLKFGELSSEEINASYETANRINQESFEALVENRKSMKQLDFSQDEIIKTMKEAGVASSKIIQILRNSYSPLPRSRPLRTEEIYDNLEGNSKTKEKAILDLSKSDPVTAKRLLSHHKRMLRIDKMGITEFDKLIAGQSVEARADYLISIGAQSNKQVLSQYARKGIATQDVIKAIKIKERQGNPQAFRQP